MDLRFDYFVLALLFLLFACVVALGIMNTFSDFRKRNIPAQDPDQKPFKKDVPMTWIPTGQKPSEMLAEENRKFKDKDK